MAFTKMSDLLKAIPQIGQIDWIGIRPVRKERLKVVTEINISTDEGLENDHYSKKDGKRQITLIQAEHLLSLIHISEPTRPY